MSIEIKFCGAAGVVTGSCYWVKTPNVQFVVDCGMFQGTKSVRELNYSGFGFNPAALDFALLTHAHIDHSGLLPKLYKHGFAGNVYTTEPTQDLLEYMLPDSAHIQETEVRRLNTRNRQRGMAEVEPMYLQQDVERCLANIEAVELNTWCRVGEGVEARFWNAGHLLGSASIEVRVEDMTILFSGDLGPDNKMFHADPESPHGIDYLVVESTYGSRSREDSSIAERREHLRKEILEAVAAGGNIIIPAFAVERTQELLMDIDFLAAHAQIPDMPIFIDSPLASRVTGVFEKHRSQLEGAESFKGRNIHYTRSVEESKSLNRIKSGAIILSASGMCEAGRVRHHLKNNLWNPANTVLFVGYQAEGTLGKMIQSGEKKVRIHGDEVEVKARIRSIETYSAHADKEELVKWVQARLPVKRNIFITHGVDESRQGMVENLKAAGIAESLCILPQIDEAFQLDAPKAVRISAGEPRAKPEVMIAKRDWHNDYAQLVLDLAESLRGLETEGERQRLLEELRIKVKKAKA